MFSSQIKDSSSFLFCFVFIWTVYCLFFFLHETEQLFHSAKTFQWRHQTKWSLFNWAICLSTNFPSFIIPLAGVISSSEIHLRAGGWKSTIIVTTSVLLQEIYWSSNFSMTSKLVCFCKLQCFFLPFFQCFYWKSFQIQIPFICLDFNLHNNTSFTMKKQAFIYIFFQGTNVEQRETIATVNFHKVAL